MWVLIGVAVFITILAVWRHLNNKKEDRKQKREEEKWKRYYTNQTIVENTHRSPSLTKSTTSPEKKAGGDSGISSCSGHTPSSGGTIIPWMTPGCSTPGSDGDSASHSSGHSSCSTSSCSSSSSCSSGSSCGSSSCGSSCGGGGD